MFFFNDIRQYSFCIALLNFFSLVLFNRFLKHFFYHLLNKILVSKNKIIKYNRVHESCFKN
jgi:hypothetical protein